MLKNRLTLTRLLVFLFVICMALPISGAQRGSRGGGGKSSTKSSSTSKSSGAKTVRQ
jgi:hypothetical protein